ncbi:MAG: MerR family transcriptional regulator, partial [Clostridia bacterium]|nr:MerR family transcriptional regulator [Clostridia bacterium]
ERNITNGYRVYGPEAVNRLQLILFYKELGFGLAKIAEALDSETFDRLAALNRHLHTLRQKRTRIEALIDTVEKTIHAQEEDVAMQDTDKFDGFKHKLVSENERTHGVEARRKYGEAAINESNRKMLNLTQDQYDQMAQTAGALQALLEDAVREGGLPEGDQGREATRLHREWLSYTWPQYSAQSHKGLVQLYAEDQRFTPHYDGTVPGCARFLCEAVLIWADQSSQ